MPKEKTTGDSVLCKVAWIMEQVLSLMDSLQENKDTGVRA